MLVNYLTIRQIYPHWYKNLDIKNPIFNEMVDRGYFIPLIERDSKGRQVIIIRHHEFNPKLTSVADQVKLHYILLESIADIEANQVNGYIFIADDSAMEMQHVSSMSFADATIMLKHFPVNN